MENRDWPPETARYVFTVTFQIEPSNPSMSVSPAEFETTLYREADSPETAGWLFFRDYLWRGDIGDETYFRDLATDALGVPVTSVSFRELQTDQAYLDALRDAISDQLETFKAESVDEALKKYLGSSIRVVYRDE